MSGDGDGVVRGRARVDPYAVPPVVGRASVPGALSVPGSSPAPLARAFAPQSYPVLEGVLARPAPPVPPMRPPFPVAAATPADADPVPKSSPPRRLAAPAGAALVAALIVGGTYLVAADRMPGLTPAVGRWGAIAPISAAVADPFPSSVARPGRGAVPTRLRITAIGVNTGLEKLRLGDQGELLPPKAFGQAGWYAEGTSPGDVGPAVIAGHVDSRSGPAVFYRLRELARGDRIEVVRAGRTERFTVVRTRWYPKADFPTGEVYGPTPDRQLRLITCGGVFDRKLRSYRENLVVYAVAG